MAIEQPGSRERHRKLPLPNGKAAEVWLEPAGSQVTMHHIRPNGSGASNWARCDVPGCLGEAVIARSKCLAHADASMRTEYLAAVPSRGQLISLRGVAVSRELLETVLGSPAFGERGTSVPISFAGAEINGRFDLRGYTFEGHLDFSGAIVRQPFGFHECTFKNSFVSQFCFFNAGPPHFTNCVFHRTMDFSFVHAERVSIGFSNSKFLQILRADGIIGALLLNQCHFRSDLSITDANATIIVLDSCIAEREVLLSGTNCAAFRSPFLRASSAHQMGPFEVRNDCTLANAQFSARVRVEVKANRLDLSGAQLIGGGHVLAEKAAIDLSRLSAGRPLRISGSAISDQQPMILALQDADAGSMTFAHVDMSRCVFYGSHDLGDVVIEPTVKLSRAPAWCTRRRVIADEYAWRRGAGGMRAVGWKLLGTRMASDPPEDVRDPSVVKLPALRASQVAAVYRDLRRSFEARSDEPGAADFYYGEMEMRRHSREFGTAERTIVWMYWLFSGYGLRASRAFAWLLAVIIGGTVETAQVGLIAGTGTCYEDLLFSLRAVIPGLQNSEQLTIAGGFIEVALTLLGPVFFALAVLALRGRVKR